ncbi:MAG: hypothetical protein ACRDD8_05170 [Bacteroidales bacterium]
MFIFNKADRFIAKNIETLFKASLLEEITALDRYIEEENGIGVRNWEKEIPLRCVGKLLLNRRLGRYVITYNKVIVLEYGMLGAFEEWFGTPRLRWGDEVKSADMIDAYRIILKNTIKGCERTFVYCKDEKRRKAKATLQEGIDGRLI